MSPWQDGMAQFLAFTIAGLSASEEDLHVLHNMADAFTIAGLSASEEDLHVLHNMADVGMDAPIAVMPDRQWYPVVDTADSVTTAVLLHEHQQPLSTPGWRVQPHTMVIFEGRAGGLSLH